MRPTTEATDTAIAIGSVFHGHVKKIQDFGACVELVPGADGLVHISQPQQTKYYKDVLKVGAPVAVKVLGFDKRGALNLAMLGEEDA